MIRLLGVGSPFGADRLAWQAIDYLNDLDLPGCDLVKLDRPGSQLIHYFQGADQVVIIDAVRLSDHPGSVNAIDIGQLHQFEYLTSSHGFGVVEAVLLARQLNVLPSRLDVLGIQTGEDLDQPPAIDQAMLTGWVQRLLG